MPERGFLIFWIFCNFFRNFLAQVEYEQNSGLKFFSLFLGLSHPVLAKKKAGKRFFNFLNFFCYLFHNFLPRAEYEWNLGQKIFSTFFVQSHPVLAKNNARKRFFNFLIFLLFFLEFSCPDRVWREFGTKIFSSLSRPISSRFDSK